MPTWSRSLAASCRSPAIPPRPRRSRPAAIPFRLARRAPLSTHRRRASQPTAPAAQSHRIDSGVVTESTLNKLPRGLSRLLLGPGVTVTPLAKDRARALGLTFERIKP